MSDESRQPLVWLVTGSSSGFGKEIVRSAARRGHNVVATARRPETLEDLKAEFPDQVAPIQLDVGSDEQRRSAVSFAQDSFDRVDVLVNNAGYAYYAALEEGIDADVRALFDTHYFAAVALTQLLLPGMRARRSGKIVNFSSIGGIMGFPGTGYYCAAKFAIEGMSEALSKEVAPLGIDVTIVEPGPFQTEFIVGSRRTSKIELEDYAATAGVYRHGSPDRVLPGDPRRAADAIVDAVESRSPPLRLLLGGEAHERVIEYLEKRLQFYRDARPIAYAADFPSNEPRR